MPSPTAGKLTPRAFAAWTAAMTLILAVCLWGVRARVGPVGFAIGFLPTFAVLIVLSWPGRFDRLLPAGLATLLVAVWPLFRWRIYGDVAAIKVYLALVGFIDAMLLFLTALEFATRRGWIVQSPVRRRVVIVMLFGNFAMHVARWPVDPWRNVLSTAMLLAWVAMLFWPARKASRSEILSSRL